MFRKKFVKSTNTWQVEFGLLVFCPDTPISKLLKTIIICFSNKDVSAKDIVSGIISAANRKMLRAATGSHQGKSSSSSGSAGGGNKKDSVDKSGSSETSKSTQKLDTIDSSKHHSRRNSESVRSSIFVPAIAEST